MYLKEDLGCTYTPKKTTIKLWSPNVEEVKIHLYKQGDGGTATATEHLLYDAAIGVWQVVLNGEYHNTYYTLQAKNEGKWSKEMPDPYAKGVGLNGNRGLIFDASKTNPSQWATDKKPILNSFSIPKMILIKLRVWHISKKWALRICICCQSLIIGL